MSHRQRVPEVNGYTFGVVWGFAGEDDGITRHTRDDELGAVDAALLLLGDVDGCCIALCSPCEKGHWRFPI